MTLWSCVSWVFDRELEAIVTQPRAIPELRTLLVDQLSEPARVVGRCTPQTKVTNPQRSHCKLDQPPARDVEGEEVHEGEIGAVLLVSRDPFVVVEEVAASVDDRPAGANLDRLRVMRGM